MKESHLLLISILVSVTGLVSLFFISNSIEVNDTTIEKITSGEVEGDISLTGVVKRVNSGDKFTSLVLTQEKDIEIIGFSRIDLEEGDIVEVSGRVEDDQIIADKIQLVE